MAAGAQRGGTPGACSFVAQRRKAPISLADKQFVLAQRRLRRGWQTIANMLGRSVHDVRATCDVTYEGFKE